MPNALILASLPESEVEAGSIRGVSVLKALEKTFGRVQALWRPIATEEAFEIVRRRIFEPIHDAETRDAVCRDFAKTSIASAVPEGEVIALEDVFGKINPTAAQIETIIGVRISKIKSISGWIE